MANNFGALTLSGTGTGANARSFTGFGFDPNELEFTVGAKNGNSSLLNWCQGDVDSGGSQSCNTFFVNPNTRRSYSDKVIEVWEHVGSTWTVVLEASFHSFITDGFKLNVVTANSDYQVFVRARNT